MSKLTPDKDSKLDEDLEVKKDSFHGSRKRVYKGLALGTFALTGLCALYSGTNLWRMHVWDKYVTKQIEIAANVPSVSGNGHSSLSMESALRKARENISVSPLDNPAIIWATPYTDTTVLGDLLDKAVQRCREIKQFQDSFETGKVQENYPGWVKDAHARLDSRVIVASLNEQEKKVLAKFIPTLEEIAQSEYGQRIGSEYESLNAVVAGGTRTSAKSIQERHHSLLDTLEKAAGFRVIIRLEADDFKQTYAHIFVGYLLANMGYLDQGINHFQTAKKIVEPYRDDRNLSLFRDTPELEVRTIKGFMNSSIEELQRLNADPAKYSTGWWKRLRYYNQSIGGQADPSIQDVAEAIYDRYWARAWSTGGLALGLLYVAGIFARRFRKSQEYEVMPEELK